MSHIHFVRDCLKIELIRREKELSALYPDNPYSTMFMDDVERAERAVTIDILKRWIRENITLLEHLDKCCEEVK